MSRSKSSRQAARSRGSERQAAYRQRHLIDAASLDSARLNMIVGIGTKRALERLSRRYGVTQRGLIERLIEAAEASETEAMSAAEQRRYYSAGEAR